MAALPPDLTAGTPAFAAAICGELAAVFAARRPTVAAISPVFSDAVDRLERFVLDGGKRIRPAFAWTGYLGAGGDPSTADAPAVLRAAAALEMIQACALVHDDIIDSSDTRRGRPTMHRSFAGTHIDAHWDGDAEHFGISAALLVGDLALAWADDMFRDAGLDPAALQRASPYWNAMRTEVLGGQLLDVWAESAGITTEAAAMTVNRYKTAAYTVERPLHLGAALAGADAELIDVYTRFGRDIGIAFQLRDDLLGVFGDPEVTGKPSGDDLREGKRTVLWAIALDLATVDETTVRLLDDSLGTDLSAAEVEVIRAIIRDLGAADEIERRIDALTASALQALDTPALSAPARERLVAMATAATARTS